MLGSIGVPFRLRLMTLLIDLVADGILRSRQTRAHADVAVLGDGLVGFFACGGATLLGVVLHRLETVPGWRQ
jgi:hypothetical protein